MSTKLMLIGGDVSAFGAFFSSGAKNICFDLEDTIPDQAKSDARSASQEFLRLGRAQGCEVGLRLSPLSTRAGIEDVLFMLDAPIQPDFFVLTKVETAPEVLLQEQLLIGRCAQIPFIVIIETPRALQEVDAIAAATKRICALSFGGKDFSKALNMERGWEQMLYARSRIVNAAAAQGIEVTDEPYNPRDDLEGLRLNCMRARAMGFTGKSAVDVRHVSIINDVFA